MKKRERIIQRDKNMCQYCGKYIEDNGIDLHIDHFLSKALGGSNKENNLVVSCCYCNISKSYKDIESFRKDLIIKINKSIKLINKYRWNLPKIQMIQNYKFYFEKNGSTKNAK